MRKSLVSLLVVAMVMSFGAMTFAATTASVVKAPAFSDISGHDAEFGVAALGGLGVFTGESGLGGAVRPDDSITRAEFCKVVIEAMGKGSIAAGLTGLTPTFTDGASIPSWAWGYVNAAQMMGVIGGYLDGSFKASNPVNYAEAITMLVRAIAGHQAQVPAGTWPYNYLWYGLDNGFTGDVEISFPNLPCPRGDMATMVLATMQVDQLNVDGDLRVGKEVLAGRIFEGTLANYQNNTSGNTITFADAAVDGITGKVVDPEVTTLTLASTVALAQTPSLEGLRNLLVWAITNTKDKVVFVGPIEGEAAVFTGEFRNALWKPAGDKTGYTYLRFWDGTVIPYIDDEAVNLIDSVKINGCLVVDPSAGTPVPYTEADLNNGDMVTVSKNPDGFAVNCVALRDYVFGGDDTRAWVDTVKKATSDEKDTTLNVSFIGGGADTVAIPHDDVIVTLNGSPLDRNDLLKWDVITVGYFNDNDALGVIYVNAVRKTVEGKVTSRRTSWPSAYTYCTIGGTEYEYNLAADPIVGQAAKYGLDVDGIFYAPISFGAATDVWWIKSFVDNSSNPDMDNTITADILGSEATMATATGEDFSGAVRYCADTSLAAGKVALDDIYQVLDDGTFLGAVPGYVYKLVSVDPVAGMVVIFDGAEYYVLEDDNLTAYTLYSTWNGTAWVYYSTTALGDNLARISGYLGLEGLHYGDPVFVSFDGKLVLLADERVAWDNSFFAEP